MAISDCILLVQISKLTLHAASSISIHYRETTLHAVLMGPSACDRMRDIKTWRIGLATVVAVMLGSTYASDQ